MNFYLIISLEIGGRFTKTGASIYHVYQQTSNKTGYNVFRPSYFPNRCSWPRKKLTRKTLDKYFHSSMFYTSINADDIDGLVMEINRHSGDIYKVVI